MRGRRSHSVVISAAVVLTLAACRGGDGGGGGQGDPDERGSDASATTAAPNRIDLSQPIPGGSLHGTPRPPLENTGDDYVAIFESLDANLRWISENPDPALISEIYVPGTPAHDARAEAYQTLVASGYRWADEGYTLLSVEVLDTSADLVSLEVVDLVEFERLVDAHGDQVGERRDHGSAETSTVLLTPTSDGEWRIASWNRPGAQEVEL